MSEKRRDKKGRILHTGESQRKDGRYLYKYKDGRGEERWVYSWRLVPTDPLPKGKRACCSLREKEQEIWRDREDGIDSVGKKMTLCQLYARQNESRANVKKSTKQQRKILMEILKRDKLGAKSIDSIKPSDAKGWAVRMKESGYSYGTINSHKRTLKASFYVAIQDGYVRKNPFDFHLNTVLEDDRKPRYALTEEQEKQILAFVERDPVYRKYRDEIVILLKTGLRISELCGLTEQDVDFEEGLIHVDHQLLKNKETGYYIETPKTKSGIRDIPMTKETAMAFQRVAKREGRKNVEIDGYSHFLFINRKGFPMTNASYTAAFLSLTKKYKKVSGEEIVFSITPHILRHTFCTRLASQNMNPKSLQYIMGHSNINITMNLYAHVSIERLKKELQDLIA